MAKRCQTNSLPIVEVVNENGAYYQGIYYPIDDALPNGMIVINSYYCHSFEDVAAIVSHEFKHHLQFLNDGGAPSYSDIIKNISNLEVGGWEYTKQYFKIPSEFDALKFQCEMVNRKIDWELLKIIESEIK